MTGLELGIFVISPLVFLGLAILLAS